MRSWLSFFAFVGPLIGLVLLGRVLTQHFGIELSVESVHDFRGWIESLGWRGPLAYILLMVIRLFMGLSTHVVLILGGVAFGLVEAIIWGGIGLTLSGIFQYGVGRYFGSAWVTERLGERNERLQQVLSRGGVAVLFLITVHPLGPQSPMTIVAGAVRFHFTAFVATMVVASPIRASIYALLGGSVLDLNLGRVMLITLGCIVAAGLPFLHPRTRQMLLGEQSQQ